MEVTPIKYNPAMAEVTAHKKKYQEGWVAAKVTNFVSAVSSEKPELAVSPHYAMFEMGFCPLRDPSDESSSIGSGVKSWQCLPIEQPHWKEKVKEGELEQELYEKWMNNCFGNFKFSFTRKTHALMRAFFPDEIPPEPRWDNKVLYSGEEEIGYSDDPTVEETERSYKSQAYTAAGTKASELYNEGAEGLLGAVVYIYGKYEPGKNGKLQYSVQEISGEIPVVNGREVELLTGSDVFK